MADNDLVWKDERRRQIESRILDLKDEQIAALFSKVGINYPNTPMKEIVQDIRRDEHGATDLDILITEASSKDKLIKEIERFEDEKER